jgi:hypothetical protein
MERGSIDPRKGATGAGSQPFLARIASCKRSICRIHYGSGSGGHRGHITKLQPHSPQAPATTYLRPLAVPLNWNFHHWFGVPVLASNQIATMNSAESGYPERSPKSVAASVLNRRKLCCDSPRRAKSERRLLQSWIPPRIYARFLGCAL